MARRSFYNTYIIEVIIFLNSKLTNISKDVENPQLTCSIDETVKRKVWLLWETIRQFLQNFHMVSCIIANSPSSCVLFLCHSDKNSLEKQLKAEKVCSGSQFLGISVQYGGEGKIAYGGRNMQLSRKQIPQPETRGRCNLQRPSSSDMLSQDNPYLFKFHSLQNNTPNWKLEFKI